MFRLDSYLFVIAQRNSSEMVEDRHLVPHCRCVVLIGYRKHHVFDKHTVLFTVSIFCSTEDYYNCCLIFRNKCE